MCFLKVSSVSTTCLPNGSVVAKTQDPMAFTIRLLCAARWLGMLFGSQLAELRFVSINCAIEDPRYSFRM